MAVTTLRHKDRGDAITSTFTITDLDGNPPSPDTVRVSLIDPRGPSSEASYTDADAEVVNVSPGVWTFTFVADRIGNWYGRWEGTGNVKQVERFVVTVDRDPFR